MLIQGCKVVSVFAKAGLKVALEANKWATTSPSTPGTTDEFLCIKVGLHCFLGTLLSSFIAEHLVIQCENELVGLSFAQDLLHSAVVQLTTPLGGSTNSFQC